MKTDKPKKSGHGNALRSTGAVLKNSLRSDSRHFDRNLPRGQAIELFREHVGLIEIETTSYCNRTCSFCPNSFIDRRSEKNTMPEACWEQVLADLRALDYSGSFFWCRYSEPSSEKRLVERIAQVRQAAPKCRIGFDSNGDYLDAVYLDRLIEAGLDRLWIDIYLPDDEHYDFETAQKHLSRFLDRIEKKASRISPPSYPELAARIEVPGLDMTATVRNLASMKRFDLSDRGGLIKIARKTSRTSPCYAPFKNLVIDWDGSVVVCCQVRSDATPHQDAVVAKIGDSGVGLVEAYVALADWRNALKGYGPKGGPCASCNVFEYDDNLAAVALSRMFAEEQLPGAPVAKALARRILPRTRRH